MQSEKRDNMLEVMPVTPYLTLLAGSRNWKGIEAYSVKLAVRSREIAEASVPIYWPQNTVILHDGASAITLFMEEERGWRKSIMNPGDLIFAPVNVAKRFFWDKSSTNTSLCLDNQLIAAVAEGSIKGDPAHLEIRQVGHFSDALLAQIGFAFRALLKDSADDTRLYAESLGVTLTHHLLYHHAKRQRTGAIPQELAGIGLKRTLEYMHAHPDKDMSLQELADFSGMSIAHFSRLFRKATARSPYQYLIQLRCERACELLAGGRYTVGEAAQAVGFFDESHFIRHFKRVYRVTPGDWLARKG